jgi:Cell wall-active antibiotics response 4TMS YvqF
MSELAELTTDLQRASQLPDERSVQLRAILSNASRKGRWTVPERLTARSWLGDCHIELQDAVLTSHVTTIEARATLGAVTIFVPDGVEVHLSGSAILGATDSRVREAALPGAPVIEVRATAILGNVTVRPPTLASRVRGALRSEAQPGIGRESVL